MLHASPPPPTPNEAYTRNDEPTDRKLRIILAKSIIFQRPLTKNS